MSVHHRQYDMKSNSHTYKTDDDILVQADDDDDDDDERMNFNVA